MIILAYDIGTTGGVKTCLFQLIESDSPEGGMSISLENSSFASYSLSILPNGGGVEQNPQEWWDAMCKTTRQLVSHNPETCAQIAGISFARKLRAWFCLTRQPAQCGHL